MDWLYVNRASIVFVASAVTFGLACLSWNRRGVRVRSLGLLLCAIALWQFTSGVIALTPDLDGKIFWAKVQYLGIASVPVLWLLLCANYSQQRRPAGRREMALLWIIPAITVALAFSNESHHLLWKSVTLASDDYGTRAVWERGPYFGIAVIYSYALTLLGVLLLLRALLRFPSAYALQTAMLLVGAFMPWVGNAYYLFGTPPPGVDLTPLAFSASAALWAWGLLGLDLLRILPIARDTLLEHMIEGVVVVDDQNRVVDLNPAARRQLGLGAMPAVGMRADELFWNCPELVEQLNGAPGNNEERELHLHGGGDMVLLSRVVSVRDRRGRAIGRLATLRDVSERKRSERALSEANAQLTRQLEIVSTLQDELHQQAVRDPLTGLFNRRYMQETLHNELARADHAGQPLAVVMLDVDHFKRLNDTCGHTAGDLVLQAFAALLEEHSRERDLLYRYGGEEFLIILPNTGTREALSCANRWRVKCTELRIACNGGEISPTASAGVAVFPFHGQDAPALLAAADAALYRAKAAGRNRVMAADESDEMVSP